MKYILSECSAAFDPKMVLMDDAAGLLACTGPAAFPPRLPGTVVRSVRGRFE